jgi:hypothetical protein
VPWWGLVSSAAAPVLLVGGWSGAARLQPQPVDPVADTVSALAAVGAADRWVMTLTFAVVGICYIVTGIALRPAGAAGRLILAAGTAAGMLVALNPQPAQGGSPSHALWASVGIAALAVWPAGAWRRGPEVPWGPGAESPGPRSLTLVPEARRSRSYRKAVTNAPGGASGAGVTMRL